ncbi:MAG: 5-formyltetrahydrofolate cyclo-ligase [Chitinophagaceae bacterium]|nr:5-formyltetrahydrofolate cyclo-ligase [Chitinophagaceae bacterium]
MLKNDVRKLFRQKRNELSPGERLRADDLILIQFQHVQLPFISLAFSYYPIEERKEVNTFIVTDYLRFKNPDLQIAYPKIDFLTSTMKAILYNDKTKFQVNDYQIPEPLHGEEVKPSILDLVLVPVLAFDKRGFRVGYGKGFYDRFLKQCRAECLKIGLCYFAPVDQIEDTNEFDVPLNFCITPQKVYVF